MPLFWLFDQADIVQIQFVILSVCTNFMSLAFPQNFKHMKCVVNI